jgi:hypothetical protein
MARLVLALAFCLAAWPAVAAPAVGALLLTAVGASATATVAGISVAAIVGTAVLTAASIGLSYALNSMNRPKQKGDTLPTSQAGRIPLRQTIPPRTHAYGRVRLGGAYVLYEVGGTTSLDVIALHTGRIGGFVQFYLHDDPVTLDINGYVLTSPWGDYLPFGSTTRPVRIHTRLGAATETAFADPVFLLPTLWTADHRGDGIASLALSCAAVPNNYFQKVYPNGLPVPSAVCDCAPVWDARDGAQDADDPDTWEVSRNPVLQLIDFLTNADTGMGLDRQTLVDPAIGELMAEAALCDEAVARVGGTEPRYESSGVYQLDTDPADVVGAILATCDGWLAERGDGTISLKVGVYRAPTVIFEPRHIVGFSVDFGLPDEQAVNQITWSYTSPAHHYKDVPGAPWRDEAAISAAGKERSTALNLVWVQSHSQGRRLAKRAMAMLNAEMRGTFVTTLYGLRGLGERWVGLQYPFIDGLEDAVVEVQKATIDLKAGKVVFEWILVDPATIDDWTSVSEEDEAPAAVDDADHEPLPVPENVTAEAEGDESGIRLVVTFDDPERSDLTYAIRHRPVGGLWVETVDTEPEIAAGTVTVTTGLVAFDDDYEVEVATIGARGARSEWSDTADVSVGDGYTPALDFTDDRNSQTLVLL